MIAKVRVINKTGHVILIMVVKVIKRTGKTVIRMKIKMRNLYI